MSEERAEYHLVTDADPDGDPVKHLKLTGTLDALLRTGSISMYMHAAGEHFAHDFLAAFRNTVKTSRLEFGTRGGLCAGLERLERNAHATRRVDQALAAVGGPCSPCAAALWYVCGLGLSIREWAAREGWNGRMLSRDEAKGILVAALAILAKDYGYDRARRA